MVYNLRMQSGKLVGECHFVEYVNRSWCLKCSHTYKLYVEESKYKMFGLNQHTVGSVTSSKHFSDIVYSRTFNA